MKNIIKIMALVGGVAGLTSCSDFLEQTSPSELNNESVYNSTYYTGLRVNNLNSAALQFNFLFKFLGNKILPRILPCQIFHLS